MGEEIKNFALVGFMEELAKRRPVFHNECDFQFEFATLAKELYDTDVRLECYFPSEKISQEENKKRIKRNYIDIVLFDKDQKQCVLIELKYKVKPLSEDDAKVLTANSPLHEEFNLPKQGEYYLSSYACLADLNRLEKLYDNGEFNKYTIKSYHSILLTNDNYYLKAHGGAFKNFFLVNHGKKVIKKTLQFPLETKITKKVGGNLHFTKIYDYDWLDYGEYGFKWVNITKREEDEVKK